MTEYPTHQRARRRGKRLETSLAKRLSGHRLGVTGLATPDIETPIWAIETKSRKALPALLRDAMAQAARNAPDGKAPLVILHQNGDRHDADIVCMRLGDFEDWAGRLAGNDKG